MLDYNDGTPRLSSPSNMERLLDHFGMLPIFSPNEIEIFKKVVFNSEITKEDKICTSQSCIPHTDDSDIILVQEVIKKKDECAKESKLNKKIRQGYKLEGN